MPELVLASTSKYRAALLVRLGVPFSAVAPLCDEQGLKDPRLAPEALALHLARAKAESLAAKFPGAVIVGSDQVLALEHQILGKPETAERALAMLEMLAGREHTLLTAMALWHDGELRTHVDRTRLVMRPLSRAQIERYLDADQPLDCAGAYKLEERGITLFSRIESADHTAITGLPLIALTTLLLGCGFVLP